ncbi:formylglycine-generating enzyme family protein [Candidatus Dependentiae bacterium]|nr:formylglycine-generating enzyme family protein [Candidatus Dependentiae bacterium]
MKTLKKLGVFLFISILLLFVLGCAATVVKSPHDVVIDSNPREVEDQYLGGQYDKELQQFKIIAEDTFRPVNDRCNAYMLIADIYKVKGDTKNCENSLIKVLFLNENYIPDANKISVENQNKLKELKLGDTLKKIKFIKKSNMIKIQAGSFMMGSSDGEGFPRERPYHKVYLDEYYISKYEVTNKEYAEFLNDYGKDTDDNGNNMIHEYELVLMKSGGRWSPQPDYDNYPVVHITWYGAVQYCKWLSDKTGLNFRLPTEAEWEYACRAGSDGRCCFGNDRSQLSNYAWYNKNSGDHTHPVGAKQPNQWGLYDMHGNVREWCSDWFGSNYYNSSPSRNPKGPSSGSDRVNRGGSFFDSAFYLRSSVRDRFKPDFDWYLIGFRPVCTF